MKWIKKGVIFAPDHNYEWMVSHASIPVVEEISDGVLRVYFGTRDLAGRSQTSYLEVEASRPEKVLYLHSQPLLALGKPGSFDDSGIMPSWIVNKDGQKYLYYIGWNERVSVPYHLSIGLAMTSSNSAFQKVSEGPILDRALDEPFFNTAPCVMHENGRWRMWYVSCTGWLDVNGRLEPRYHVKYAESKDGILWRRTNRICIDFERQDDAIGRPCVYREGDAYKMLFSYRGIRDYRTDVTSSYRLGYAESPDGLTWSRHDEKVGIERSASGWDSEMLEYCYFYRYQQITYLFYNGNGFGRTGVGYAVLDT